jgi:hypothetical protein
MHSSKYLTKLFIAKCILVFGVSSGSAVAVDVYDAETNRLYIPSVQVGDQTYVNVVVTLDQVISVGGLLDVAGPSYNLQAIYESLAKSSSTYQFSLKGAIEGSSITGTGTQTTGTLSPAVFQGVSALTKTSNITFSIDIEGQVIPSAATVQYYYDSNYNFLGQSGADFEVVTSRNPFPTAARQNDAGVLYDSISYTSSDKTSIIGTQTTSYSVTYDTEASIILTIIRIQKDPTGSVIQTNTSLYRVTSAGVVTRLLETGNNASTFLTINF